MIDADKPVAGYYRQKLVKGGPYAAIRIWFGAPICPETGELMDRSLRWQARCNGKHIEVERVWPWCGRDQIGVDEYDYLMACANHAGHAASHPHRKIDVATMKPGF